VYEVPDADVTLGAYQVSFHVARSRLVDLLPL
jgi:hypothetical protein